MCDRAENGGQVSRLEVVVGPWSKDYWSASSRGARSNNRG